MWANFAEAYFLGTALKISLRRLLTSSIKLLIRHFDVNSKKCLKKRGARAIVLFCITNLLLFSRSRCPSPSSLLKLPKSIGKDLKEKSGRLLNSRQVFYTFLYRDRNGTVSVNISHTGSSCEFFLKRDQAVTTPLKVYLTDF